MPRASRSPVASACEPQRDFIEDALSRGRLAKAIFHDVVTGFAARYASVLRSVCKLRGARTPESHAIITTAPGEEAQVDYGERRRASTAACVSS